MQRCIFGIGAVTEPVPDILGILDVALGVQDDGAENRINRIAGAQPFSNCLVVKPLGCSGSSGIFLDRGKCKVGSRLIVSVSGTAVGIEVKLLRQLVAGAYHERALR